MSRRPHAADGVRRSLLCIPFQADFALLSAPLVPIVFLSPSCGSPAFAFADNQLSVDDFASLRETPNGPVLLTRSVSSTRPTLVQTPRFVSSSFFFLLRLTVFISFAVRNGV